MLRMQVQCKGSLSFSIHNARLNCSARTCSLWPSPSRCRYQLFLRREMEMQGVQRHFCRASNETFLTQEEAGLIELANLDMHERFLCRLTVSSLNLLRVISKQEGVPVEDLNAGIICDWFQKDKAKRETDFESATLKW
eukprot:c23205_g1_i2 orf=447-860(-)